MDNINKALQPSKQFHALAIPTLNPGHPLPTDRGLDAEVVLLWPYSSSTRRSAILISELDFRLRRHKGQVRVQLRGPAAQALAASHISIGDHVHIGLEGARWADEADRGVVIAPGRAVDGELVFERELHIKVVRENTVIASINLNEPPSPIRPSTPLPSTTEYHTTFKPPTSSSSTYASPAFMQRGGPLLRSTIRPAFVSQPDPLPFSTEDMIEEELDADRPRKKAKFGRKSGDWVFKQESPSPELKPEEHEMTGIFDDVEMIENELVAEEEEREQEKEGTHNEAVPDGTELEVLDAPQDEMEANVPIEEPSEYATSGVTLPQNNDSASTPGNQNSKGSLSLSDRLKRHTLTVEETVAPTPPPLFYTLIPGFVFDTGIEVPQSPVANQATAKPVAEALAKEKQSAANGQAPQREAVLGSIDRPQALKPDTVPADVIDAMDALAAMGAEDIDKLDKAEAVNAEGDVDQAMATEEENPRPELDPQSQPSQSRQSNPRQQGQEGVGGGSRHRKRSATPPRISPRTATAMDALALIVLDSLSKSGKRINRAGEIEDIKDEDEDMESGENKQPDFGYDGAAPSKPFVQHQKFSQLAEAAVPSMTEQDVTDDTTTDIDQDGNRKGEEQEHTSTVSNVRDGADNDSRHEQDVVQEDEEGVVHSENDMVDDVQEDDVDDARMEDEHVAREAANVSETEKEDADMERQEVDDDGSSDSEDEIHAQPTVENETDLKHVALEDANTLQAAEEDVDMGKQHVLVNDSSEAEDEIHAQPTVEDESAPDVASEAAEEDVGIARQDALVHGSSASEDVTHAEPIMEDESALKHVASAQTNTSPEEDVQHEEKQHETAKPALRGRGRTKKLMTFEEATAASQPLEIPGATAAQETHIGMDEIIAEEEEVEKEEEEHEIWQAEIEAEEQVGDLIVSVQQAEETANYLLEVLAESSNAVASESNVEQATTVEIAPVLANRSAEGSQDQHHSPALAHEVLYEAAGDQASEPAMGTSLRGATLSPALAAEHQLEKPAALPRHGSLPEAPLTPRETRSSKGMFKPRLPRQASKNSGNLSIINKLEDEYLSSQLLAQPQLQSQSKAVTEPKAVAEPRIVTEPRDVAEPGAVTKQPHLDNPLPVQTPSTSRKTRSTTKSVGRKSNVPNELRGWFSPRVEIEEASSRQKQEDKDEGEVEVNSTTENNDLHGMLRREEDQQIELSNNTTAHNSGQVDMFDSGKVQASEVEEHTSAFTKAKNKNTKQTRKPISEEPHPKTSHEGLQTTLSYYTPLSNLHLHLNRVSSQSEPNTVDVLAVVSSATSKPSRATSGPRDHFTTLKITTPPAHGKVHIAFPQTQVQIFRQAKDVLPVANVGDVVLLRDFVVRSAKGKCFLLSTASSAWCVWRYGKGSHVSVECLGRPVEIGDGEENHAKALRKLWVLGGKEEDVEREAAVNGSMG